MRMPLEWLAALMLAGVAHAAEPVIGLPSAGMGAALAAAPGEEELEDSNTSDVVCEQANAAAAYRDESTYMPAVAYAPGDRGYFGVNPGVMRVQTDITLDEDGGTAVVSLASRRPGCSKGKGDSIRTKGWKLNLTFPIDDADAAFAHIATLDGLAGGVQLEFEKTWSSKPVSFVSALLNDPRYADLCSTAGLPPGCSKSAMLKAVSEFEAANDTERATQLRSKMSEFARSRYGTIREYAVSVKAGEGTFDYLTPDLGEGSAHRIGWSVGASASFVPPARDSMWATGLSYGRTYRAGRDVILCPPATGTAPVECVAGPLGAPTEHRSKRVWASTGVASATSPTA